MVMPSLKRLIQHGFVSDWQRRKLFSASALSHIEQAIRDCESQHAGEIRFAVETALPFSALWKNQSARSRAIEVFAREHVWDTAHNNGVLIYLLLAERDVEIIADRGVGNARVDPAEWEACCHIMETYFRQGEFEAGSIAGIRAVAAVLARHPPAQLDVGNEISNQPLML